MVANQHPADLNPFQRYRQARAILRGTSRATNDGWYLSPLDLDFQVHLRIDGEAMHGAVHDRKAGTWSDDLTIPVNLLGDLSLSGDFAKDLIARARRAGAESVGLVLHIADEFATTELKPDLDNPGALVELRETIIADPGKVLDDSSLSADDHSWRLIPYPAAGSETIATAVTLSRHAGPFVEAMREQAVSRNFPIATLTVSAPLIALLALPEIKRDALERPLIAVLPYSSFTLLAFFNSHGDLQLLRTLQHRGQQRPSNLRHAASTTAAALEMAEPEIHILHAAAGPDPDFASDLRIVFENSTIHETRWEETDLARPRDGVFPEMLLATRLGEEIDTPLAASHTFSTLRSEGWAAQDFLPVPPQFAEVYPTRVEMRMLRSTRWLRLGLAALVVLCFGWLGLGLVEMIRQPEWTFEQGEAQLVNARLRMLRQEEQRIAHWDNLLADRSKGWANMEMLARLFPERSGFLIRTYQHSNNPENVAGQAKVGFVKQWRINGLVHEESLEKLAALNTREGISAAFAEIARVTGNPSFRTDLPTRSIIVNIKTLENSGYKPRPPEESAVTDESIYPFLFDLTITQRFEADDPLAISTSTAP